MKKAFLLTVVVMSMFSLTSCEKEILLAQSDIPSEITAYVTKHFPKHTIVQAIKDKDGTELTYDIILSDNVRLEFNRKKEIIDISSHTELPDSVIPEKILSYVRANYSDNYIKDWEIDDKKPQTVELDNKLELVFDLSGNFLRLGD